MSIRKIILTLAALAIAATAYAQKPDVTDYGTAGKVKLYRGKDSMTDKDKTFVAIKGDSAKDRSLMISCTANKGGLQVLYAWQNYLISESHIKTLYRFDGDKAVSVALVALGGQKAGLFEAKSGRDFVASARMAKTLRLQVIDSHDGETVEELFNLEGLPEALSALSCVK